jgi:UMF1 family MFS transporter
MESLKKERVSWYIYDWANSAFSTSVITVFIGPYLTGIAEKAADSTGYLNVLGIPVFSGSYFAYVISISVILQVLVLPFLGSIADNSNLKKRLLGLFAYIGSFSTIGFYFLEGDNYLLGGLLLIVANLSFGASAVMYNAYLNDISQPDRRDAVSSIGWAIGYIGGGVNLGLNLVLFSFREQLGIDTGFAVRICLVSAGIWWAMFTIIPMIYLRTRGKALAPGTKLLKNSFAKLLSTIKDARNHPQTLILLCAYLLYNDGVQAVITLSAQFGVKEISLSMQSLTILILMIQFVAFGGALLFNRIAKRFSTRDAIIFALILWIGVVVYSYGFLRGEFDFYIVGVIIGIIMGGTQALSRSIYSRAIPAGQEAEYFSLYEVSEKGTSWMGPLVFGLSLQLTESYRYAILSLVIFFVVGLILLLKFKETKNVSATVN